MARTSRNLVKKLPEGAMTEKNYRDYAKAAIESLGDRGALLDAIFWGRIIRYYENDIEAAQRFDKEPPR